MAVTVLGLAVLALTGVVAAELASSLSWNLLDHAIGGEVQLRPGVWRVMRGTLHFLAIPALMILGVAIALEFLRRSRRVAATYCLVGLAANLSIQGIKHGATPGSEVLNPLSGHVGVAAAVCLGWLAFSPRVVRGMGWAAGAVVGGVSGGMILASWHTVPQVLCPLGIVTGWVVLGTAMIGMPSGERPRYRGPAWAAGVGAGGLAVGLVVAASFDGWLVDNPWWAVALAQGLVAAATCLSVGTVLLARAAVAGREQGVAAVAELS